MHINSKLIWVLLFGIYLSFGAWYLNFFCHLRHTSFQQHRFIRVRIFEYKRILNAP